MDIAKMVGSPLDALDGPVRAFLLELADGNVASYDIVCTLRNGDMFLARSLHPEEIFAHIGGLNVALNRRMQDLHDAGKNVVPDEDDNEDKDEC